MKFYNLKNKLIILILLFSSSFSVLANTSMIPFHAEYQLFHGSKNLGSGYYKLEKLADGQFKMGYQSAGSWLFLEDIRTETSYFAWQDEKLQPHNYQMQRQGSGPSFSANVKFIAADNKVLAQYKDSKVEHVWQGVLFDPLLYHLQLRLDVESGKQDMHYQVAYKTNLRDYHYKVVETELLELTLGNYQAIKVERIRHPDSKKETLLWLIPELNYVLGRVAHYENGDLKVNMVLDELQ
ncbi:MAG: DUF3108 domain-containing protein [Psychromonas sp.]